MNPQQFEEHTQSLYRLRSARNKRRSLLEDRDKQLLALSRERDELWIARRNQPWEELNPPYQRGWKRSFVLRDDVARSPAASFYEGILQRINTVQLSSRPDFKRKKRKHGRKVYVERGQELQRLNLWEWQRAGMNPKQSAYFRLQESRNQRRTEYHYVFLEPWRFQLRTEKHMITQLRKPLSPVEARLKEIDNWLALHDAEHRMHRIAHGTAWRHRYRESEARNQHASRSFTQTPLHRLMADAND